jgi:ATP-binding cassette subfamily B protein/subfamily B ATP-binding cassette protein MsbA
MSTTATPKTPTLSQLCRWVLGYATRRSWPLAVVAITLGIKIGLDLLKPWPMFVLVDYVLGGKVMPAWLQRAINFLPGAGSTQGMIGWTILATVGIFLLGWAAGLANAYANITLGQRMTYDLAADLLSRLQQLSLSFHQRRAVGDTIRRVTSDCTCVATIFRDVLIPIVSSLITLAVMFGILWRLSPWLTILAMLVVPYMMWIFRLYAQPMMEKSWHQQEVEGRLYSVIERTFSAMPIVQAYSREQANDELFRQATAADMAATLSLTNVQLRFRVLMGMATAVGSAGVLWLGARQALSGDVSVGGILLFISYLGALYAPVEAVMYTSATMQSASGSARRVWEVLEAEQTIKDKPGAIPLPRPAGHVQFNDVTMGYVAGQPILQNLSLDVAPGETIALVGATGAGKSTLVGLIPRFFDPWQGAVLLDGRDLRDVQLKSLRREIAIVLQEPFLFPLSIAENIAYGRPQASMADIEAAARAANVHEFIRQLPAGYQTIVGERGATLSGGERQRVSIARALLKDARLLILDEPTSALDAETEASFLQALERLKSGRTTFIIAHRLSTVRRANRIVVLERGRIVETGSHSQLLEAGGVYARLYRIQFSAPEQNAGGVA